MRILQLIQKPQTRGAEIFTCQLSNHLLKRGHEVIIVAIFKGDAVLPFDGKIISLDASMSNRLLDVENWKRIYDIIRDFNPDLVQANAGDTLKYAVLSKLLFRWKQPVVSRNASEVGRYLKNPVQKKLNTFLYKRVDFVISVSKASENDILNNFPLLKQKTNVIPVGIENKPVEKFKLAPVGKKHIMHVGGFSFEKNHEGLLRIFKSAKISLPNLHLHLIGDGPLKVKIKDLARELGLESHVTFHGYVDKPLPFIAAADIIVLPSVIEGLPAVILEAMYCKTSIIAYNVGGISEVLTSGLTGHLIQKNDEAQFSKVLVDLVENENSDCTEIMNAKKLVDSKYTNQKIAEEFENCYSEIIEESDLIEPKKLKILQLVTKRQYRGAELFAADLSQQLIKFGHEIAFVGIYKTNDDLLRVEGADNRDLINKKSNTFSIEITRKLVRLLRQIKPDIVQCNGSDTLKYMYAASYFVKDIPVVYRNISIISEWVSNSSKKFIYKNMFNKIDYVTSVGDEALADFIKTYNYPKNNTDVIRRGVPIKKIRKQNLHVDFRKELGFSPKTKIAVHIGNFSPEKNHEFLLEVFEGLKKHEDIKLICVGNGITMEKIQDLIIEKSLEKSVFLLGFRKDIPEILAASDCLVLSSKVEGVPGVILEAGTQKTPSIATNVGGVREALINGETGFLIDHFSVEQFRQKLILIMNDDELRFKLGKNAYEMISEGYDAELNARKFESLYKKLLTKTSN